MDKYIRLPWPEYQSYMEYEGYEENAVYDVYNNTVFMREDWFTKMNEKYGN